MVLLLGWGAMFLGAVAGHIWFANPLLFAAWITFLYPKVSVWFSIFAVIFSASFPLFTEYTMITGVGPIKNVICHQLPGYWLWLSSTIVMLVGNGIQLVILHNKTEKINYKIVNVFIK
jgi:hypothetical protein